MLDAFRELIDELIAAPKLLRDAGAGESPNDDVRSSVALLTVRDLALYTRIQTTIRQDTPFLKAPPATGDDSVSDVLSAFDVARGELVSQLMNLTLKDWERPAIDWNGAEITVADDVESHVEFDEVQQDHILNLLKA